MKNLILATIAILICNLAKTQEYIPFNFEKGIWMTSHDGPEGGTTTQYLFKGDTSINGAKYYKIYQYSIYFPIFGLPDTIPLSYCCCIRNNENKQVILYDSIPKILYDFNLKVGDTIINGLSGKENNPIVKQIDSILICGVYHKRYKTQYLELGGDSVALIEGIGMNQCLLGLPNIKNAAGEFGYGGCYTEVGNNYCFNCNPLVHVNYTLNISENIKIFPNPSHSILTLISSKAIKKINITDLAGRNYYFKSSIHKINVEISTKQFNSGYYLLHIQFQDNTFISKPFIIN